MRNSPFVHLKWHGEAPVLCGVLTLSMEKLACLGENLRLGLIELQQLATKSCTKTEGYSAPVFLITTSIFEEILIHNEGRMYETCSRASIQRGDGNGTTNLGLVTSYP